ncbi:hypothetical protein TrCOL_g8825 [Triparma columacea]|uniref:GH16 domain-containing protein n=1 Tax=Triparma columacea TaxID=722753 RepID=A0A9W7GMB5_9STRA|nr:hypothetical protein TrCOL_g8825 [Triparma columacea]
MGFFSKKKKKISKNEPLSSDSEYASNNERTPLNVASEDEGFTSGSADEPFDERYLSTLVDNRGKLDEARYQTVLVYIVICSLFIGVGTAVIQASSVLRLPIINSQDDIYYFDDDDGEGGSNRHFGRYIGPYQLKEKHLASPLSDDGDDDFLKHYNFLNGSDSKGSNGYVFYVDRDTAIKDDIIRYNPSTQTSPSSLYLGSSATKVGPRHSIRLEGLTRFQRGLFLLDLNHMPSGCGTWPAFWLVNDDPFAWPYDGEIDIVEGVNLQDVAKTALHTDKHCDMSRVPIGRYDGEFDTATGIPDKNTGVPSTETNYATNCFVYDSKQWVNQGCVMVSTEKDTLGEGLNERGGAIYALEWDPSSRHIRSWVFPKDRPLPLNLEAALENSGEGDVLPDPEQWPLPYGYFPIGPGTDCALTHFKHMRLVFNLAFCGSVSGTRFKQDCPALASNFDTCEDYISSNPDAMSQAYWDVSGVYVYERQFITEDP